MVITAISPSQQSDNMEKVTQISCFHTTCSYFLGKLKSIREGDGTLLDHSMVVYGSSERPN